MSFPVKFTNSPELGSVTVPLSHAVQAGGLIYLSGQTGVDPRTGAFASDDVSGQTRQTFENLGAVLKTLGKSYADVVKCNVYLTSMSDFAAMNAIYAEYFEKPQPARTTVAVLGLPLGAKVEIEMIVAA